MRLLPLLVASVFVVSLAGAAAADEAGERQGRALFAEGNQLLQQGELVSALERFRGAYARFPNVKILLNMGTTLRQLGRNAEAADTYEAYLRDPAADPARKAEVERLLEDLDAHLARLVIDVAERGARVRVDGKVVGKPGRPVALRVEPGSHTLVTEKDGTEPAVTTITVAVGEQRTIRLAASKSAAPATPVVAPITREPASPVLTAPPPPALPPKDATPERPSRSLVPPIVALGLGGVGAVVGTVFFATGLSAKGDFNSAPNAASADKVDRAAIGADVGYGVAIVGGAVGLAMLLWPRANRAAEPRATATMPSSLTFRF